MNKYIENLYKVLFENNFDDVKENTTILTAIGTICWTSLFLFFSKYHFSHGAFADLKLISSLILYLFSIYFFWFITALFFEFIAKVFGKAGNIRQLLMLSSYSLLPYIFMAPLEMMKKFSSTGYFWGTKFELLLFLWVIIIYASSLAKTYDLKKSSSYLLVFLPLVSFLFAFIWLIGSFFNLGYIYSV